jgi:phytanoyl-CoA dioxygenase PhyH
LSATGETRQTLVVLTRSSGYLTLRSGKVPSASTALEMDGYTVLKAVLKPPQVESLSADVQRVFAQYPPDVRDPDDGIAQMAPFRYEMLNRSALVQRAVGNPRILRTIEPLLGEDCHVIANTAWWQPPGNNEHLGRFWHTDAGPHIPRDPGVPWDPRIPYPIFAIAAHIFLRDCPLEAGPTGVIPGSHTSGQPPPIDRLADENLDWEGHSAVAVVARAGDVALFVSDIWHSRLPPGEDDPGRMFIQCHYGRRDIAQRIRPTTSVNHLSKDALARARTPRQQTLIGHHPPSFYDG